MTRPAKPNSGPVPKSVERDYLAALRRAGVSPHDLELLRQLATQRQGTEAAAAKRSPRSRHG